MAFVFFVMVLAQVASALPSFAKGQEVVTGMCTFGFHHGCLRMTSYILPLQRDGPDFYFTSISTLQQQLQPACQQLQRIQSVLSSHI